MIGRRCDMLETDVLVQGLLHEEDQVLEQVLRYLVGDVAAAVEIRTVFDEERLVMGLSVSETDPH